MSLPILPNTSNFLAVALVINRLRDGPRFVFHYPPSVPVVSHHDWQTRKTTGDDDFDDDGDFVDRAPRPPTVGNTGTSVPSAAELAHWNRDDHFITESGSQIVPWEYVAGFPTKALEAILTPAKAYHKTLFQVSLDPLYCVSYPIYAPENGIWKKKKKKRAKPPKSRSSAREDEGVGPLDSDSQAPEGDSDQPPDVDKIEVKDMAITARDRDAAAEEGEDKVSSMTMFNLVFILNPENHEARELIDTMYTHIIKKVNKLYKYCQQRSDFVWKESKRILALKDKAREDKRKMNSLWSEILSVSSLAASMQDVYEAISQNKIAALQLETPAGTVTHSVQIPMPYHISDLPQEDEEAARGLWITTANVFLSDDSVDEPDYLVKNFGLLLMDDDKKIISELQADPDDSTMAMIEFVRHSKPTLSFYQVAQQPNNILTLAQVSRFARHFISWRRAIAIPPLHMRDTYIVSPNCDVAKLPRASADWARAFPIAPPLPDFLAALSAAPRPYKSFCPAKSYRPEYLKMLAWLLRSGWVTQLCTFAYVVVWPEILYEVEYTLEAEELAKAKRAQQLASDDLKAAPTLPGSKGGDGVDDEAMTSSTATVRELSNQSGSAGPANDLSSSLSDSQPRSPALSREGLDDLSTTSSSQDPHSLPSPPTLASGPATNRKPNLTPAEVAAEKARLERLADKAARELAEKATAHSRKASPQPTAHPSVNDAPHLAHLTPHLILDARKPTGRESLYLSAIGRRLRARRTVPPPPPSASVYGGGKKGAAADKTTSSGEGGGGGSGAAKQAAAAAAAASAAGGKAWDERVADAWPLFWKYFNGRAALERVALQEEMKRKEAWTLMTAMSEYLFCVRHW